MEQYILMIYSDNCDPFAYGIFNSEQKAKDHLSKLQKSWSESEWYHHKDHILKLKEINKRSKS
jgi:hypothetical protein